MKLLQKYSHERINKLLGIFINKFLNNINFRRYGPMHHACISSDKSSILFASSPWPLREKGQILRPFFMPSTLKTVFFFQQILMVAYVHIK